MAKPYRPRFYSDASKKLLELIKEKEDAGLESWIWDIYYKLANGELKSGNVVDKDGILHAKMQSQYVEDLQDLYRICNIDPEEHELVGHDIGGSQTPMKLKVQIGEDNKGNPIMEHKPTKIQMFHIKAKLKPKMPKKHIFKALDSFEEKASKHAPIYNVDPYKPNECAKFAEISIYDLHVGKHAWERESGTNYDTKEAIKRFRSAFRELVNYSISQGVDELIIPLGNDMVHFDNSDNSTTGGTPQDTDGRWQYVIEKTEEAIIEETDRFSDKVKFHFKYVPGNHDEMFSYFICKYLKAWYKNHPNVEVDAEPTLTKYYRNGSNLIVYNHFKDVKPESLVQMMSIDKPQDFADCWYREAHGGHFHTRSVKGVSIDTYEQEYKGITYRVLPSLCETDAWHRRKLYDGNIKMAQALIYKKEGGIFDIKPYIHR